MKAVEKCVEFIRDKTLENMRDPAWTDVQF